MNNTQLRLKGWLRVYNYAVPDLAESLLQSKAPRRVCSQDEHSCCVTAPKHAFYWLFRCAHEQLWSDPKCAQCERIGINTHERKMRFETLLRKYQL